jgi:hypothetical protein
MTSYVRRALSRHPLFATLTLLSIVGIVCIAKAGVYNNHHTKTGQWYLDQGASSNEWCVYERAADSCEPNTPGSAFSQCTEDPDFWQRYKRKAKIPYQSCPSFMPIDAQNYGTDKVMRTYTTY